MWIWMNENKWRWACSMCDVTPHILDHDLITVAFGPIESSLATLKSWKAHANLRATSPANPQNLNYLSSLSQTKFFSKKSNSSSLLLIDLFAFSQMIQLWMEKQVHQNNFLALFLSPNPQLHDLLAIYFIYTLLLLFHRPISPSRKKQFC